MTVVRTEWTWTSGYTPDVDISRCPTEECARIDAAGTDRGAVVWHRRVELGPWVRDEQDPPRPAATADSPETAQ